MSCSKALGSRQNQARLHIQDEHHRCLDGRERNWLGSVGHRPGRNSQESQHAGHPVDRPRRTVLIRRLFPGRDERRDRPQENHEQAGQHAQNGIVEYLPENNPEDCSTHTGLIELAPTRNPVLQRQTHNDPCTQHSSDNLAIERSLRPHPRQGDSIECRPDDPSCLAGLSLTPPNRLNVRQESNDEQNTRSYRQNALQFHDLFLPTVRGKPKHVK